MWIEKIFLTFLRLFLSHSLTWRVRDNRRKNIIALLNLQSTKKFLLPLNLYPGQDKKAMQSKVWIKNLNVFGSALILPNFSEEWNNVSQCCIKQFPTFNVHWSHLRNLLYHRLPDPGPIVSDLVDLDGGPQIFISNKFPGDAHTTEKGRIWRPLMKWWPLSESVISLGLWTFWFYPLACLHLYQLFYTEKLSCIHESYVVTPEIQIKPERQRPNCSILFLLINFRLMTGA